MVLITKKGVIHRKSFPLHVVTQTHHSRDSKVSRVHLLGEPIDFAPRIAKDDCLGDGQRLVEIAERVQLPLLPLHADVELFDT